MRNMTKLIAEIGWNHMGDMDLAKNMILAAKSSGTDFVKTQIFNVKSLKPGPWDTDGRREIYEKAQLNFKKYKELREFADTNSTIFFASVFSKADVDLVKEVNTDYIKIPSMESRNEELIQYCAKHFDNIIISTGTSNWNEIRVITQHINECKVTLLHCVSSYPCDFDVVNLPRINDLKRLSTSVGFSDHTQGIEASVISLGYGIDYIEKHFTTDNNLPGRDNKFAILPDDMKKLSKYVNISNKVMISKGPDYQDCESDSREIYSGRWNGF